jgi:hypothetical protein
MSENDLETIMELLPLLVPILIIQLALVVAAIIDLSRRETTRGPKVVWVLVILLVNFIGPILYFVIGRDEG